MEHSDTFNRVMAEKKSREKRELAAHIAALIIAACIISLAVFPTVYVRQAYAAGNESEGYTLCEPFDAEPEAGADIVIAIDNQTELLPELFPIEAPESESNTESPLSGEDEYILAKMAMAEAEAEDTEGKALVMRVILNRVDDSEFPDTVEGVISQKDAFTPYRNGRYDRVEPDEDCFRALAMVESGWDESQGAMYFEAAHPGTETWHSKTLRRLFQHGSHIFYVE